MIDLLAETPVLLVFVVLAVGAALGAVKVRGVSLGPAGALFAGLALSAVDDRLAIAELVGIIGLALFTYTIGLASGPVFFSSIRAQGRIIGVVALVLVVVALCARAMSTVFDLGSGVGAGLFAGSLTNTPALAAAVEALDGSTEPVVGYSVAYPIGVLGMIVAAGWALRVGRNRPLPDDHVRPADLATVTLEVRDGASVTVRELVDRFAGRAVFARIERDGVQFVPSADVVVQPGDLVSVAAHDEVIPELVAVVGGRVSLQLSDNRSHLDMRRMVVSDRRLTGRRLADLDLYARYGAVATRVRRGDVDLLAHDDVTVLPGDRLRVVAPRDQMSGIAAYLGDSERRIAEIDALGFMVGITVGIALGLVKVPILGGNFSLGNAGGPLVVGLLLGRLERTGSIVWQPPYGANLALRQFGTILFLGTVGSRSGGALADALGSRRGASLVISAVVLVSVAAMLTIVIGRSLLRLGGARLAGVLAGVETQPAVLAFAAEQSSDDRVSTSYALVFPVAMLVKILLAQLLILL